VRSSWCWLAVVAGPHARGRRSAARAFFAIAAGGIFFLPWLPSFLYQSAHTGTPWASAQQPFSIAAIVLADFGGGGFGPPTSSAPAARAHPPGGVRHRRDRRHIDLDLHTVRQFQFEVVVLVVTLAIGILVSTVAGSAFASRYAAVFFPLFVLLVAGITRFADRRLLAGAFSVVLALSLMGRTGPPPTSAPRAARPPTPSTPWPNPAIWS
jgi:hypothetical protein